MGFFEGIEKAQISERGKYLPPNFAGTLKIKRTLYRETLKSGPAFIVEFEVVASNLDTTPVGSECSWYQSLRDRTVADPAIKAFAAACAGYHRTQRAEIEAEVAPNLDEMLTDCCQSPDDNALTGTLVDVRTWTKKTQKGLDFTAHDWSPAAE
jgi:hypothetical protein